MNNTYICYTIYHLLISLVNIFDNKNVDDKLIITTRIVDANIYKERICKYYPGIKVQIVDDNYFKKTGLYYKKNTHKYFNELIKENNNIINIFNDFTQIGYYLHRNKIEYKLQEDGCDCLKHPTSIAPNKLKNKIKNLLTNTPRYHGFSKYCTTIYVNDLNGLPNDIRKNKYIKKSKKNMFYNISPEDKIKLLNIFNVQSLYIKEPAVLILTQPLEKHFTTDESRYNFYKNIVHKYLSEYNVYLKVHPRDNIDYSNLGINIISRSIPVELLSFAIDKEFEIGVTYFSTALDSLDFVKSKVSLYSGE